MAKKRRKDHSAIRETLLLRLEAEGAAGIDRIPITQPRASSPSGGDTQGEDAKQRPRKSDTAEALPLQSVEQEALVCTACPLHETRTRVVFGEGNPSADLVFVGEAPGRDEDLSGRPFVGRAGQLLTRMIEAMGFERADVFIANVLKCRPPGNRTPALDEIASCLHFLKKQIALIAPKVIVALGAPASRTLLASQESISALRGRVHNYPDDDRIRVVPCFHPAYLLRNEAEKPKAWQDLKLALKVLSEASGKPEPEESH